MYRLIVWDISFKRRGILICCLVFDIDDCAYKIHLFFKYDAASNHPPWHYTTNDIELAWEFSVNYIWYTWDKVNYKLRLKPVTVDIYYIIIINPMVIIIHTTITLYIIFDLIVLLSPSLLSYETTTPFATPFLQIGNDILPQLIYYTTKMTC